MARLSRRKDGSPRGRGERRQRGPQRRREEKENELENFRRRAEWWRLYHGDESGVVSSVRHYHGLAQALRMEALGLSAHDPGGERPRRGFELIFDERKQRLRAKIAENPRPASSLGFASDAVRVEGPPELHGVRLKLGLANDAARRVRVETVRVFCFDDESRGWQFMPRSGVSVEAGYAWAHLHRTGLFIAIGLPAEPAAMDAVLALHGFAPRVANIKDEERHRRFLGSLAEFLANPDDETAEARPARVAVLPRLDLPRRGLPEIDILDDICPEMPRLPGKRGNQLVGLHDLDLFDPVLGLTRRAWRPAGPRNFNGRIKCLAIHPTDSNAVYAGAACGGVWVTHTGGASWSALMHDELSLSIGALAISKSNPQVLYAGTGEDTPGWGGGTSFDGVGVYRTVDGGASWTLCAPIKSNRCTQLLIHPTDPNTVYVSGDNGLHKTPDGGVSWTDLRTDHVCDIAMHPVWPDTIYAAVWSDGIYTTINGGSSWSTFNEGLPTGGGPLVTGGGGLFVIRRGAADWIRLAISDRVGDRVWLLAKMGRDSGELYRRRVFQRRIDIQFPPTWNRIPGDHEPADYNEWTNMPGLDPLRHNVIFAGGIRLKRSTDSGASFSPISGTHDDHHGIVFARGNTDVCYLATDGGVYRSTDNGASWAKRSNGLVATQLYSIGVSQDLTFRLGGATQDEGIIQTQAPPYWNDTSAGNEGGIFVVDPRNHQNLYCTPWSTNLRRSTDGGAGWTTILTGITQSGTPPVAATVVSLAVNLNDSRMLLCAAGNEVFRSTDRGANWSSVFSAPAGTFPVRVVWHGGQECYLGTNAGAVFRSTSQGSSGSWSRPYANDDRPPNGVITAIEPRTVMRFTIFFERIYIAYSTGGRVFRSFDGGAHWEDASGTGADALPNVPISALVVDKDLADTVYAATDVGLFRTRDAGNHWESFNSGMPRVIVTGLELRRRNNTLYASTMGRGAWRRTLT